MHWEFMGRRGVLRPLNADVGSATGTHGKIVESRIGLVAHGLVCSTQGGMGFGGH